MNLPRRRSLTAGTDCKKDTTLNQQHWAAFLHGKQAAVVLRPYRLQLRGRPGPTALLVMHLVG